MLANCLLPSTVDVADNTETLYSNISTENDATRSNIETELADDDDVAQELRDDSSLRDEAEKGTPLPANNSILGDFSLFRDFFFAAFSDGCYKVSCCGTEGLFSGSCISQRRARELSNTDSFGNGSDRGEVQSLHSADLNMNRTGSYEGVVVGPPQRTRPLAVAVGFKYAEDMNGRPIVITPGSRRMSIIDRNGALQSHHSSPASQSIHTKKVDIVSNVLFPIDHSFDA